MVAYVLAFASLASFFLQHALYGIVCKAFSGKADYSAVGTLQLGGLKYFKKLIATNPCTAKLAKNEACVKDGAFKD